MEEEEGGEEEWSAVEISTACTNIGEHRVIESRILVYSSMRPCYSYFTTVGWMEVLSSAEES